MGKKFETHYVNTVKPDLRTLKLIKEMFLLHSDNSAMCNGYRSLCSIIDEMDKQPVIVQDTLLSTCDDNMFSSGEIKLTYQTNKTLKIVELDLDLQVGSTALLRKNEVKDLIDNLQTFYDILSEDEDEP